MKRRIFSVLAAALLLMTLLTGIALADGYAYSDNYPLYVVSSYSPSGYCYMYDRPTSTYGENLGSYKNGEVLKVISTKAVNGYYLVVDSSNRVGYVSAESLIPYGTSRDYPIYYVDSVYPLGYCYMYDRPTSTYGKNLGSYKNGARFEVLDWNANESYAKVCSKDDGKVGYIGKRALVKEGEKAYHQTATVKSELGYIYMYDRPTSTYGNNLGEYKNDVKVYILKWKYNEDYAKVVAPDGKMGYMLMDRLQLN